MKNIQPLRATPPGSHSGGSPSSTGAEPPHDQLLYWVNEVVPVYAKQNASALEIGRVLHRAKEDLRATGLWTKFLKSEALPFSKRRAEMLVRVWEKLNDLDAQTFAHLPAGWSILYELSYLERQKLLRLIEARRIHPKLTLAKAKELAGRAKPPTLKTAAEWVASVKGQVKAKKGDWPVEDQGLVASELVALARSLA